MKAVLDQEDVELIARQVVEMIRPFLSTKAEKEDTIFSVEELAEYLRVSMKYIYDHTYELPHFKMGGLLRFRKREIDHIINQLSLTVSLNRVATR